MRNLPRLSVIVACGIMAIQTTAAASMTVSDGGTWLLGYACNQLSKEEVATLDKINAYRDAKGLSWLYCDSSVTEVAWTYSNDMCQNGAWHHVSSDGKSFSQRMAEAAIEGSTAPAENIAAGYAAAESVFNGWKKSPGHNSNMLMGGATRMGIARIKCPHDAYGYYWTLILTNGKPMGDVAYLPAAYQPYDSYISTTGLLLSTDQQSYVPGQAIDILAGLDNPGKAFNAHLLFYLLPGGSAQDAMLLEEMPSIPVAAGERIADTPVYKDQIPDWLPEQNALVGLLYDAGSKKLLSWTFAFLGVNVPASMENVEAMNQKAHAFVESMQ